MKVHEAGKTQFADGVSTPPSIPGASDGTSLSALQRGGTSFRYAKVKLLKSTGTGDITLTGPVVAYCVDSDGTFKVAELNEGNNITLSDSAGYSEVLQFLGTYDRFELVPAGQTASTTYDGWISGIDAE